MSERDFAHPLNILEIMDGAPFPASKPELIEYAQDNDASEETLDQLRGIPERDYHSLRELGRHLNRVDDLPGSENLWSSEPSHDLPSQEDSALVAIRGQGRA